MSPTASIVIREHRDRVFYEAYFRHDGHQVKRRIGPAWIEPDNDGGWRPKRGRVPDGFFDERRAHVAAAGIVAEYVTLAAQRELVERERRTRGPTFREVAEDYMRWLREVKKAKPATLRDRESVLAEPGGTYRRGERTINGHVMAALGDQPASKITTRQINQLLTAISDTGVTASTVNKYRAVIVSVFNYGMREATHRLPGNPAADSDRRREPDRSPCSFIPRRRSRHSPAHSPTASTATTPNEPTRKWRRIRRTASSSGSPPTPDSASESCSHCAGRTSTSPDTH